MKLQLMRSDHLSDCARLYAAVFNRAPWKGKWTTKTAAKHIQECLQDPNFRGLVAIEESEPIGFAYGLVQQWENDRHFYLKEMCVNSIQQRGGVGTRLLTHLIEKLRAENVRQISLGTGRGTPAESFYLWLGFEPDPKIIIMNKRLKRAVTQVNSLFPEANR